MKLEVGQFVRTKDGYISQYKYYDTTNAYMEKLLCIPLNNVTFANIEDIVKASYNIIDILEEGDYVNGCKVHRIANCITIILDNEENISWVKPSDIKSIVTHEQMEQMAYKVGE